MKQDIRETLAVCFMKYEVEYRRWHHIQLLAANQKGLLDDYFRNELLLACVDQWN